MSKALTHKYQSQLVTLQKKGKIKVKARRNVQTNQIDMERLAHGCHHKHIRPQALGHQGDVVTADTDSPIRIEDLAGRTHGYNRRKQYSGSVGRFTRLSS